MEPSNAANTIRRAFRAHRLRSELGYRNAFFRARGRRFGSGVLAVSRYDHNTRNWRPSYLTVRGDTLRYGGLADYGLNLRNERMRARSRAREFRGGMTLTPRVNAYSLGSGYR